MAFCHCFCWYSPFLLLLLGLFEENARVPKSAFVFLFSMFYTFCQKTESRPRANGTCPDHPGYEVCYGVSFPSTLFINKYFFIRLAADMSWAFSSPSNRTTAHLVAPGAAVVAITIVIIFMVS